MAPALHSSTSGKSRGFFVGIFRWFLLFVGEALIVCGPELDALLKKQYFGLDFSCLAPINNSILRGLGWFGQVAVVS
jgi:hypothetical protein